MKNSQNQLSPSQKAMLRKVVSDPVRFAREILGLTLWEREVEILRSIQTRHRTAIRAAHGLGKTFTLAAAVLWWLAYYEDGIVLTTAPTLRQVETQLWREIHKLVACAKIRYTAEEPNTAKLKFRGNNNFALGLSTDKAESFQGYHARHILIIVDEAPGIEATIWDAFEGIMAGGDVRIVMAGNPTRPSGPFFDAFHDQRGLWNCITIDAFDSPNLVGLNLEQLLQMDPREGGPLDENPNPYLVSRRWVYEHYQMWWHDDEASSPQWQSRVRGQFPDQSEDALIKLSWLENAQQRAESSPVRDTGGRLIAGVDVGGGEAETVVCLCELGKPNPKVLKLGAWRGQDTRGQVVAFLKPYLERLSLVRVDADGIGHNFALHLRSEGFRVEFVHVGLHVESRPGPDDPSLRFFNLRAQYYQHVADLLQRDELDGLRDATTIGQLASIRYELDAERSHQD